MQKKSIFARLLNWFKQKASIKEKAIVRETPIPKCPHCGNVVELLLPCMEFGNPVVYKCAHCQCTITEPGTSMITESGNLIPYWNRRENIIKLGNEEIKFVGKIHSSVGWEYDISYPEEAFSMNQHITYHHPEMMEARMCGGDEATIEYTLKPLKTGLFCIGEKTHFRGNLKEWNIHYFLVE